jgi:hypothetical protein
MNYKVGDRVKHQYQHGVGHGGNMNRVGTVVSVKPHDVYGIDFDEHMNGHDCNGRAREGHGWNCYEVELELIPKGNTIGKSFLEFNWPC